MEWSLTQNKLLAFHRLMRTDKPIGALLLLWPTLWALWVATPGMPQLWILAVFVAGVWLMRAAGCVVNDYADRKFDGHVKPHRESTAAERGCHRERSPNAVCGTGAAGLPAGFDPQHDDHFVVRCGISISVGLPVYEALYASAAGGAGGGVWLVGPGGVRRRE